MTDGTDIVTTVVARRVPHRNQQAFADGLKAIMAKARAMPGHRGASALRLEGAASTVFTVIFSFASPEARDAWIASPELQEWRRACDRISGPLVSGSSRDETPWFAVSAAERPWRLRGAMVSFLGVFPTITLLSLALGPFIAGWPLLARSAFISALMTLTMTYLVMPALMRHLAAWTYGAAETAPIDLGTIKTIESSVEC
jgi:antibiotic biosynthesis monooxygenase (ABM) superfamily enzyme